MSGTLGRTSCEKLWQLATRQLGRPWSSRNATTVHLTLPQVSTWQQVSHCPKKLLLWQEGCRQAVAEGQAFQSQPVGDTRLRRQTHCFSLSANHFLLEGGPSGSRPHTPGGPSQGRVCTSLCTSGQAAGLSLSAKLEHPPSASLCLGHSQFQWGKAGGMQGPTPTAKQPCCAHPSSTPMWGQPTLRLQHSPAGAGWKSSTAGGAKRPYCCPDGYF